MYTDRLRNGRMCYYKLVDLKRIPVAVPYLPVHAIVNILAYRPVNECRRGMHRPVVSQIVYKT